ncbi:putative secreted protein [Proteiniphilum saccharofermentans]|uniref:Putative secreted protein n=1 Tax=Proteiniphilum saccharofermentans TaxID=1642647 RepID=A0A1R3T6X1_9BACT|nr:putative collagen-binding domain-containing protein [Proteiniphilum saccharofermentans]SCD21839.1 putative secreted protein [Proteiniphilum saccharofermentans]
MFKTKLTVHLFLTIILIMCGTGKAISQALLNQPGEDLARMALAKSRDGTFAVVYIPAQGSAKIDMSFFKSNIRVQWFDPRNNDYYPVEGLFDNRDSVHFSPSQNNDEDWVLLMRCD